MSRKYHRRQVVKAAIASSACLGIAQPTLAETETSEREGGLDAFNSRFEKVAAGNSDSRGVTIQGSTGKQTIQERIRQIEPIFVQTDGRPVFGDEDSPESARGARRGSGRRRRRRVGQVPNELLAKSDDYRHLVSNQVTFENGRRERIDYYTNSRERDWIEVELAGETYRISNTDEIRSRIAETIENATPKEAQSSTVSTDTVTGQTVSASASGGNRSLPSDGRTDETLWESKEDGADIGDGLILGHQLRSNSSEVHAAVQVAAFSDAQIGAEIYEQYDLESSGHIRVDGAGTYRGSAASGLAGGRIQGGVFIRESGSSIWSYDDYENGLDVNLGIVGGWGEHANWDCNMLSDEFYDSGTTVEIGVRLKLNASAVATSSAIVDLFTSASGDPILEVPGFFDFSYLDIDYQ